MNKSDKSIIDGQLVTANIWWNIWQTELEVKEDIIITD